MLTKRESSAFIKRLKTLHKALIKIDPENKSISALAAFTGTNRQTLTDWMKGRRTPSAEMAELLEVRLAEDLTDMDLYSGAIRSFFDSAPNTKWLEPF